MAHFTINIDMNKKCIRCRKGGACDNGLCMACIAKAMKKGEFDHLIKKNKTLFDNMETMHKEKI